MAKKERIELDKKEWTSRFTLVGEADVNDFTFKMNQTSDKSDWMWNQLNLKVDCGEKYGKVFKTHQRIFEGCVQVDHA
jgi:hypothetical protein